LPQWRQSRPHCPSDALLLLLLLVVEAAVGTVMPAPVAGVVVVAAASFFGACSSSSSSSSIPPSSSSQRKRRRIPPPPSLPPSLPPKPRRAQPPPSAKGGGRRRGREGGRADLAPGDGSFDFHHFAIDEVLGEGEAGVNAELVLEHHETKAAAVGGREGGRGRTYLLCVSLLNITSAERTRPKREK